MEPDIKKKSSKELSSLQPTADLLNTKTTLEIPSDSNNDNLSPSKSSKTEDTDTESDEKILQEVFSYEKIYNVEQESEQVEGAEDSESQEDEMVLKYDDDDFDSDEVRSEVSTKIYCKGEEKIETVENNQIDAAEKDILKEIDAQIAELDDKSSKMKDDNENNSPDEKASERINTDTQDTDSNKDLAKSTVMDVEISEINTPNSSSLNISSIEHLVSSQDLTTTNFSQDKLDLEDVTMNSEMKANSTEILDQSNIDSNSDFKHDSSCLSEKVEHHVNRPNVMTEIPTQELIDMSDYSFESSSENLVMPQNMSITPMNISECHDKKPETDYVQSKSVPRDMVREANSNNKITNEICMEDVTNMDTKPYKEKLLVTPNKAPLDKEVQKEDDLIKVNVSETTEVQHNNSMQLQAKVLSKVQQPTEICTELKSTTPETHDLDSEILSSTDLMETDSTQLDEVKPEVINNSDELPLSEISTSTETSKIESLSKVISIDRNDNNKSPLQIPIKKGTENPERKLHLKSEEIAKQTMKVDEIQTSQLNIVMDVRSLTSQTTLNSICITQKAKTTEVELSSEIEVQLNTSEIANKPLEMDIDEHVQLSTSVLTSEAISGINQAPETITSVDVPVLRSLLPEESDDTVDKMTEVSTTTSQLVSKPTETNGTMDIQPSTGQLTAELDNTAASKETEMQTSPSHIKKKLPEKNADLNIQPSLLQFPADADVTAIKTTEIHPTASQLQNQSEADSTTDADKIAEMQISLSPLASKPTELDTNMDVQPTTPQLPSPSDGAAIKTSEMLPTMSTKLDVDIQPLPSQMPSETAMNFLSITEIPPTISQLENKPIEIDVQPSTVELPSETNVTVAKEIHLNTSTSVNKPTEINVNIVVQPLPPTTDSYNTATAKVTEMQTTLSQIKGELLVKNADVKVHPLSLKSAGIDGTVMHPSTVQLVSKSAEQVVDVQLSTIELHSEATTDAEKITEMQTKLPSTASEPTDIDMDVQPSTSQVPSESDVPVPKMTEMLCSASSTSKATEIDMDVSASRADVPAEIDTTDTAKILEMQPTTSQIVNTISVTNTDVDVQPSTSQVCSDDINDTADVPPSTSQGPSKSDVAVDIITVTTDAAKILEMQPTKSQIENTLSITNADVDVQPSTSQMCSDDTNDAADATDSLGLLAECSRVRDDDEEAEQETSEHDYDDDDNDFDQNDEDDESSNQMEDQSEESAQQSESDVAKLPAVDIVGKEIPMDITEDPVEKPAERPFLFKVNTVVGEDIEESLDPPCDEVDVTENEIVKPGAITDRAEDATQATAAETLTDSTEQNHRLRQLLLKPRQAPQEKSSKDPALSKLSPSKTKILEISPITASDVLSIVELEESSSDDEILEVFKEENRTGVNEGNVTNVNISSEIEVMSSGENTSDIKSQQGDTVITVPKAAKPKSARKLNTSEVTITTAVSDKTKRISETKVSEDKDDSQKPMSGWEVFNLDSDEEDTKSAKTPSPPPEKQKPHKCVNLSCTSDSSVEHFPADAATMQYYDSNKKNRPAVCRPCAQVVANRATTLIAGIKDFTPLLRLDPGRECQQLVEILDSDSDEEEDEGERGERLGEGVLELEGKLASMLNETWVKYKMDARLKDTEDELNRELEKIEMETVEVDAMLSECQKATDKLRSELYAAFEGERMELSALVIVDTPDSMFAHLEPSVKPAEKKRRLSSETEMPAKKQAIPLGHTIPDMDKREMPRTEEARPDSPENSKMDDDKDVSVVRLSAEAAPAELPPPGELVRAPLRAGLHVYATRNAYGCWLKARILDTVPNVNAQKSQFTMCNVRFDVRSGRSLNKVLPARCLAYWDPPSARMTIGTRLIALFKANTDKTVRRDSYYSGVVAEIPNPVNKYRYLVFFDDGYAQYVHHADTRLVCEFSSLVWEEVHPFSREFVREYLLAYPERPMVRLHTGQSLKAEWDGKWWPSKVLEVDASLVKVHFEAGNRTEWIYRGSTRLAPLYLERQAAGKTRLRPLPRNRAHTGNNMPYVEYTRSDEQDAAKEAEAAEAKAHQEELRRQRAVAKKSTTPSPFPAPFPAPAAAPPAPSAALPPAAPDAVTSRVVYYTPKNAIRPHKLVPHSCGPHCKRTDVLALKDLKTYNPLAKPLLSGWERQIVRFKGHKEVMYRAPCGRRLRDMPELLRYLQLVQSDMGVDLFDFAPNTHCLAEFVLNKCIVGKKDLSHGKENMPVPCVNYYDDSLPEFCSYNTERTPTAGVPLNLDPDFLCGCDCADDCQDKSKCACWQLTLEGARTIGLSGDVGYSYKRLPDPLPSGIYECNSRCRCKSTCLNRVVQHPLQLKLQVFKTLNRGWGIRALNDVPKGSFLCIYAGNLLTDATANLDGLNEGDEYLAELDYIEVVEQMKEGYEDDIPDNDKRLDKELDKESSSESSSSESEAESPRADGDFEPAYEPRGVAHFSKRLRKREKKNEQDAEPQKKDKDDREGDDTITISDDEELREPARFAAQAGMGGGYVSKYRSVRSLFGQDEACYIMDAKVQGNIGRYLNHSCSPNVFVQNVFVDTHDPRFPWVAFFALSHIRAGTELTWNYNYDVGSVPGKALYCYCGAVNCRGRLL